MTVSPLKWVASSAALIIAVLFLRSMFGKRISARLRYALWGVVLLRLLVPAQLFTAPVETPGVFSEISAVQTLPGFQRPAADKAGHPVDAEPAQTVQTIPSEAGSPEEAERKERPLDWTAMLGWLWLAGSAAAAAAFLVSNWTFSRRLRRVRVPLEGADCPLRVYTAAGLPSPCLFGVLRPSVYVTEEAAGESAMLRHVLVHEITHFRHGDHVWSLLRCAALAVHWWDPLVWLAAVLSRRDCELACDEGALKRLGDGERRAYGGTLLALVTVKPRPGDLLNCATTMTGDKRSLRERVGRVARAPKRWLWAAVLSAALAVLVCACAFAGTEAEKDGPLTEEELEYFNTQVFNGEGFNIRNQFLLLAVKDSGDYRQYDLFQLFYNGTGMASEVTDEERQAVIEADYGGEDPMLDLVKCPADQMDEVLRENLGLGLEDTDRRGLDQFTYLEDHDAYYTFHGDTNYPGNVDFTAGERKDGKILLYYEGYGFPLLTDGNGELVYVEDFGPACVTLEERKGGGYRFLTNWHGEAPAVPTVYPGWEPELVIPLDGLEPYQPAEVRVERHKGDAAERLYSMRFDPDGSGSGCDVEVYRSVDGNLYASVVVSETERDCFLTIPDDNGQECRAEGFTDLFGYDGVEITYNGWLDERYYGTFHDYYTFSKDGTPSLLLRAKGETVVLDLDGDGADELAVNGGPTSQLFFQRNGQLYEAELKPLLQEAWTGAGYMDFGFWGASGPSVPLTAQVDVPGDVDYTATAFRTLWFDGKNLRLYKYEVPYTDHVKYSLSTPEEVMAEARNFVQETLEAQAADGYGADGSGNYDEENFGPGNVVWDDWRITELSGPFFETAGGVEVEIWNLAYELHTTTPERVILAGGSYLGEDGWCMIGYPGCDYLCFLLDEGGNRTFLFSQMENDCSPGTELFRTDLIYALADQGLVTLPELDAETLMILLDGNPRRFLDFLGEGTSRDEREWALETMGTYIAEGPGMEAYINCVKYLNATGEYAGGLTAEGRAAWKELRSIADPDDREYLAALREDERRETEDIARQTQDMSLSELFDFYYYQEYEEPNAAYSLAAMSELMQRLQKDPAALLTALADWGHGAELADDLGASLYLNRNFVPGTLEQVQALELEGEQAALRDRVVSAYAVKKEEQNQ